MEKSWVHSGEGFEAQLVCIVYADPQPTVSGPLVLSLPTATKALDVIEPHYAMLICIIEIGTRKLHLPLPVIALLMFLFFDSQISKLLSARVGECIR